LLPGRVHRPGHQALVDLVRARPGQLDDVQGQAERGGLGLEQYPADTVHRYPPEGRVHRGQQPDDLDLAGCAGLMQRQGAVLAA